MRPDGRTTRRPDGSRADKLERIFLRSITLCVCLSSWILARAEGTLFPVGVTPVLALTAYFVTDRRRWFVLPIHAANVLGGVAAIATATEFFAGDIERKLLSGAHMLVYLTWIVLLMRKGIRQFWWLCALSVLQLAVASILTKDVMFGASLVGMLLLLIWTLSVFTLFRIGGVAAAADPYSSMTAVEADSLAINRRGGTDSGPVVVRNGLQIDAAERWIGWRFHGVVSWTFVGSLAIAAVVFAAFPRVWVQGSPLAPSDRVRNAFQHRTGFAEEVQLGEIGEIMQSDVRVLQFSIRELHTARPVTIDEFSSKMGFDALRFRGNVLGRYEKGRWSRGVAPHEDPAGNASQRVSPQPDGQAIFAVRITQDPPVGTFAFAVMPLVNAVRVNAADSKNGISQRRRTQTLVHRVQEPNPEAGVPVTYEVHCPPLDRSDPRSVEVGSLMQVATWLSNVPEGAAARSYRESWAQHEAITPNLSQQVPKVAALAESMYLSESGEPLEAGSYVDEVVRFLNSSGGYTYSSVQRVTDPILDPVEDFLMNHKSGHCEYFASACALMLQSVGIPARVVNGYKGSEINTVTGQHEVKQKHAHSWVEAWVDGRWNTVDPTPASEREQDVGTKAALGWLTNLRTALADTWYGLVQSMTLDRQKAIIKPIVDKLKSAGKIVRQQGLLAAARLFFTEYVLAPGKWFSWQGGVITFVLLSVVALIVRKRPWRLFAAVSTRLRTYLDSRTRAARSVIRFYESFCNICERHGLPVSDTSTALENAIAARRYFAHLLTTQELQGIPERVAAAFNSVRFGKAELSPDQAAAIRGDVALLAERLEAGTPKPAGAARGGLRVPRRR